MGLRVMTADDIDAGMRLKEIAGWNQTRSDWERFLRASPRGCFVAEVNGTVVGSVTTMGYQGRFAWIGMVLVDPAARGQGIGTALLHKAVTYLDEIRLPCVKLDATPLGKPLYEKLGFVSEYELARWQLEREARADNNDIPAKPEALQLLAPPRRLTATAGIKPLTLSPLLTSSLSPGEREEGEGSWGEGSSPPQRGAFAGLVSEEVFRQDREVFGADRSALLRSVASENPGLAQQVWREERLAGYCFGRRGALADHLGPWVADDESSARELLDGFLARSVRARVFVDAVAANAWATRLLQERAFECVRPLTRMYRGTDCGSNSASTRAAARQGAIMGPEFG